MNFNDAFIMQRALQKLAYDFDLWDLGSDDPGLAGEHVRTHVLAATDELHEILRETSWKPWSKKRFFNRQQYKEEMVDLFHFIMNLMLIGGITPEELLEGYAEKHEINIQRQKDGY